MTAQFPSTLEVSYTNKIVSTNNKTHFLTIWENKWCLYLQYSRLGVVVEVSMVLPQDTFHGMCLLHTRKSKGVPHAHGLSQHLESIVQVLHISLLYEKQLSLNV